MEQHREFTLAPLPLGVHSPLGVAVLIVLSTDVSLSREQKLKYD